VSDLSQVFQRVVLTSERELILITLTEDSHSMFFRVADLQVEDLASSGTLDELTTHFEARANLAFDNFLVVRHGAVDDALDFFSSRSIVDVDGENIFVQR
jgi:hypothetical protein